MQIRHQRITIIRISKPQHDLNEELQWFGNSLDLFGERDKDKSCFRVFIEILKATRANHPMSSEELSQKLGLSRGTIIHHLNRLMEAGIVMEQKNRYILRAGNLYQLVEEIEKDTFRTFQDLKQIATDIDHGLR